MRISLLLLVWQASWVNGFLAPRVLPQQRHRAALPRSSVSATPPPLDAEDSDAAMREKYLDRIGIPPHQALAISAKRRDGGSGPDLADLQRLLTAHLFSVPFENLDQHPHPPDDAAKFVPRRPSEELPSLDVRRSLRKIVHRNRGGFCYELNPSFAWLLRSVGFRVRLAVADVGCSQNIPAHVVVLVDGLMHDPDVPVLVDVGFGTPGVCDVVLPLVYGEPALDIHGDSFRFVPCEETARFDTILYRKRLVTGDRDKEEPMYRFCARDNLPNDSEEFALGLHHVLNNSPTFTGKRLCVLSTDEGHCTLGEGYVKWMERGEAVRTDVLESESQWREALAEHFGVVL